MTVFLYRTRPSVLIAFGRKEVMRSYAPVLFFFVLFNGAVTYAKPLTEQDIRNAKTICIMPGTFDPITDGHLGAAQLALTQGGADIVILVASENPKKNPIPRAQRMAMMNLAASDLERVLYAKDGDLYTTFRDKLLPDIARKIRSINPSAEIDIVVGSDVASNLVSSSLFELSIHPKKWLVVRRKGEDGSSPSFIVSKKPHQFLDANLPEVSSSGVKALLLQHPEYYSQTPISLRGIRPKVAQYIFSNRTYQTAEKPVSFAACAFKKIMKLLLP